MAAKRESFDLSPQGYNLRGCVLIGPAALFAWAAWRASMSLLSYGRPIAIDRFSVALCVAIAVAASSLTAHLAWMIIGRRLLSVLGLPAAVSMPLFLAFVTLWWRSTQGSNAYWSTNAWAPTTADRPAVRLAAWDGAAFICVSRYVANPSISTGGGITWTDETRWGGDWHGFEFGRQDWDQPVAPTWRRTYSIGVPLWFATLAASLPLCGRVWQRRRGRVQPGPGVCQGCGYDLRATPIRCPECGRPAAAGPRA
jgi:hypothetical protein